MGVKKFLTGQDGWVNLNPSISKKHSQKVLLGIMVARGRIKLHGIARGRIKLHGIARSCTGLHGIAPIPPLSIPP